MFHAAARYGGSKNFKMPSVKDSHESGHAGTRRSWVSRDKNRSVPDQRPAALSRGDLVNMNRLIARKMRDDLEAALEIADDNSMRNADAAALK
jgi:hypothetical protein